MYDEEAQRSSQNYLAIGLSLEEKCKMWEGDIRHEKEIWHVVRRDYLVACGLALAQFAKPFFRDGCIG